MQDTAVLFPLAVSSWRRRIVLRARTIRGSCHDDGYASFCNWCSLNIDCNRTEELNMRRGDQIRRVQLLFHGLVDLNELTQVLKTIKFFEAFVVVQLLDRVVAISQAVQQLGLPGIDNPKSVGPLRNVRHLLDFDPIGGQGAPGRVGVHLAMLRNVVNRGILSTV